MPSMTSDRFHKAAKDGNLEILKEATSSQCNTRDEDGMTPTLWAAFMGHLEALRLLVGRGGDVDRSDNFGNTALHFAAARGHMSCVTFLVNWGANLWSMDIDFHTPKELAAMNNREDILRYLDGVAAKEETNNKKTALTKQQKAQKTAEKLAKNYEKLQEESKRLAEKQQKKLLKEKERMQQPTVTSNMPHRPSTVVMLMDILKRRPSATPARVSIIANPNPTYSEIVSGATLYNGRRQTKLMHTGSRGGAASAVINKRKAVKGTTTSLQDRPTSPDFTISTFEADGKKSIRSLQGLRRDSQIIYTGSFETTNRSERGNIQDVFENIELTRSISEPEFLHATDSGFGDDLLLQEPASIFDRPGFGSVAFRNSMSAVLNTLPYQEDEDSAVGHSERGGGDDTSSIGSAGSLRQRGKSHNAPWDEDEVGSDDEGMDTQWTAVHLFLVSAGLGEYTGLFIREKVDLDTLMLMDSNDFERLGLKLGPVLKLTKAIQARKAALARPGKVGDSKL